MKQEPKFMWRDFNYTLFLFDNGTYLINGRHVNFTVRKPKDIQFIGEEDVHIYGIAKEPSPKFVLSDDGDDDLLIFYPDPLTHENYFEVRTTSKFSELKSFLVKLKAWMQKNVL
jgi:hypothetical protein